MSADQMEAVVRRERVVTMPNGKRMVIAGLGLQDFVAAREEALRSYRRSHVKRVTDIGDLMPADEYQRRLAAALDEAAAMTIDSLPEREVSIPLRDGSGRPVRSREKPGEYVVVNRQAEYSIWWMSETPEGRLYMVWRSMRSAPGQESVTLDDADEIFRDASNELREIADQVGELSSTSLLSDEDTLGNSPSRTTSTADVRPTTTTDKAAGLSRRERRALARQQRRAARRG